MRFLFPPEQAKGPSPLQWQGPSPLPQCCAGIRTGRGPKAPGQRPPRPRRALLARRVGRWPFVVPGPAGLGGTVPRGRGKRDAFLVPARTGEGTSNASMAGAIAPATSLHWHQDQPGAKAPGQRPPRHRRALCPAGSGAGLCFSRTFRSTGHCPARAEKREAFLVPARTGEGTSNASMAGAIAFATGIRRDQDQPGAQSPRPALALPPASASHPPGRALASVPPGPAGLRGTVPRAGGGNAARVSCFRPKGQSLSPDREGSPGRLAVGLLFRHPVKAALHSLKPVEDRRSLFCLPRLPPSGLGKALGPGSRAFRQPDC